MTNAAVSTERSRRLGGLLMWFGVLGGALAWAAHLIVAWGLVELTCAAGGERVAGVPLRTAVLISVVVPALVCGAALVVSWVTWRRLRAATGGDDDRALRRADMMALVGFAGNALFLAMILAGGAAVLVFPPCQG